MTILTDATETNAQGGDSPPYDAVREDETLDASVVDPATADMTWAKFTEVVSRCSWPDALKLTLLQVTVSARGHKGEVIDLDEIAKISRRKRATVQGFLVQLVDQGWVERSAKISDRGRPMTVFRTTHSIGG
jgi:response regulator of citrate/malate metabolism